LKWAIKSRKKKYYLVFQKFDNCPDLLRRGVHPDPPDHEHMEQLCDNEGTCKNTGFYTISKQFHDHVNETLVSSGKSYEGFCLTKLKTIELLGNISECCLEFRSYNLYVRICADDITVDDGITLIHPLDCSDCTPEEYELLHVFILIDYNEDTGYISLEIIINKEVVWTIEDIFLKSGEDLLHVYDGHVYHYAMFEQKLDKDIVDDFTDMGLDREADQEYCLEEYTEGERIFEEIFQQSNNLFYMLLIVFGIWIAILIIVIFVAIFIYIIWRNNFRTKF
jgi:hypothetical protein